MTTGVAMQAAVASVSIIVGAIAGVVAVAAVMVWAVSQRI